MTSLKDFIMIFSLQCLVFGLRFFYLGVAVMASFVQKSTKSSGDFHQHLRAESNKIGINMFIEYLVDFK